MSPIDLATSLLADAAVDVVRRSLGPRGRGRGELPREVEEALGTSRELQWSPPARESGTDAELGRLHFSTEVGAAAISIDPDAVFRDARARIARMHRVNMAMAVALGAVLITGIAGVVMSALVLERDTAAIVFGGIAFADVLALAFTKPFATVTASVVGSQRLEIVHLRLRSGLADCAEYEDLDRRFECRRQLWKDVQEELRSLT